MTRTEFDNLTDVGTSTEKVCTSADWYVRCIIRRTATSGSCDYYALIQLKPTKNKTRYQHWWYRYYSIDNGTEANNYVALPEVPSSGYMSLIANTWYDWGSPYKVCTLNNNGTRHTIKCRMWCTETVPRHCPQLINNNADHVSVTFKVPQDPITPGKPSAPTFNFNEDTRNLSVSWVNGGSTSYYILYRTWKREDGTVYGSGDYGYSQHLLDVNIPVTETIPEEVASVEYQVTAYSATGDTAKSTKSTTSTPANRKVWIKDNGTWKKTIPWVKVNGTWCKCKKTYIKINGVWHLTKF